MGKTTVGVIVADMTDAQAETLERLFRRDAELAGVPKGTDIEALIWLMKRGFAEERYEPVGRDGYGVISRYIYRLTPAGRQLYCQATAGAPAEPKWEATLGL